MTSASDAWTERWVRVQALDEVKVVNRPQSKSRESGWNRSRLFACVRDGLLLAVEAAVEVGTALAKNATLCMSTGVAEVLILCWLVVVVLNMLDSASALSPVQGAHVFSAPFAQVSLG